MLSSARPSRCIPVGVIVERRKARSAWLDFVWRPIGVFNGASNAAPWTMLSNSEEGTLFYAGAAEVDLYRSETAHYRRNLLSPAPSLWVALHPHDGELPYKLGAVTADPAEGEGLTEA